MTEKKSGTASKVTLIFSTILHLTATALFRYSFLSIDYARLKFTPKKRKLGQEIFSTPTILFSPQPVLMIFLKIFTFTIEQTSQNSAYAVMKNETRVDMLIRDQIVWTRKPIGSDAGDKNLRNTKIANKMPRCYGKFDFHYVERAPDLKRLWSKL